MLMLRRGRTTCRQIEGAVLQSATAQSLLRCSRVPKLSTLGAQLQAVICACSIIHHYASGRAVPALCLQKASSTKLWHRLQALRTAKHASVEAAPRP